MTAVPSEFDIVTTYRQLLKTNPDITMPVAAIDSLVLALAAHHTSTVSETLEYLKQLTQKLINSTPNPVALSAGTDLFQRYLVSSLQTRAAAGTTADLRTLRAHLLSNGRLFVQRAKESRDTIAGFGKHFIRDGHTVLSSGSSRVVGALLKEAAQATNSRFKVIYVFSSPSAEHGQCVEGAGIVASLRKLGVPVAIIGQAAVAHVLDTVDMVIVGAEGIVENGGVISRLGTYQLGILAKSMSKPFYVVAESHKFVRQFLLGQQDLPIKQKVLDFKTHADLHDHPSHISSSSDPTQNDTTEFSDSADAVDYTPPQLISGIITESGILTPSAVSEELIKIWY